MYDKIQCSPYRVLDPYTKNVLAVINVFESITPPERALDTQGFAYFDARYPTWFILGAKDMPMSAHYGIYYFGRMQIWSGGRCVALLEREDAEEKHKDGCPRCGRPGNFVKMALVCSLHGVFGGI
jgi:hypothetical protein